MKTLSANGGKGEIQKETIGIVTCTRYVGQFTNPNLVAKAETGMWYTMMSGNPFVVQGEGDTPELAIKDSIARTEDKIDWMQKGLDSMPEL
jgi:hypothetical protein